MAMEEAIAPRLANGKPLPRVQDQNPFPRLAALQSGGGGGLGTNLNFLKNFNFSGGLGGGGPLRQLINTQMQDMENMTQQMTDMASGMGENKGSSTNTDSGDDDPGTFG